MMQLFRGVVGRQLLLALCVAGLWSSALNAKETYPSIVQSGHSLTDGVLSPLSDFIRATGPRSAEVIGSTIPGSPLEWRWKHAAVPDIRQPDQMSKFDVLVITERVPLANTMPYHASEEYAARWCALAWEHGSRGEGARCVLYASWVHLNADGPSFEERLLAEQSRWETILEHLNAVRDPQAPIVPLIPGPQILLEAAKQIEQGDAPGISHVSELFYDNIHLNDMGNYMIAVAHYAVIFERDPRGLPHGAPKRGGPNLAQATWMQNLVWDVLNRKSR